MARAFALGAQPRTASVVYPPDQQLRSLRLTEIASECNISHSKWHKLYYFSFIHGLSSSDDLSDFKWAGSRALARWSGCQQSCPRVGCPMLDPGNYISSTGNDTTLCVSEGATNATLRGAGKTPRLCSAWWKIIILHASVTGFSSSVALVELHKLSFPVPTSSQWVWGGDTPTPTSPLGRVSRESLWQISDLCYNCSFQSLFGIWDNLCSTKFAEGGKWINIKACDIRQFWSMQIRSDFLISFTLGD